MSLKSVTIPNYVTYIGYRAFNGCSCLTMISSLNPTPPSKSEYSFDNSHYQYATLYVPQEALEAYKTTYPWSEFKNIQGFDPTGIKGVEMDGSSKPAVYYDLNGRKLNAPKKGLNIVNGKKVIF